MKEQTKKRLVVDTSEQFHYDLKKLALEEKRTISEIVKQLVQEYMDDKRLKV